MKPFLHSRIHAKRFGGDNASMWATREGIEVGYYDPGY